MEAEATFIEAVNSLKNNSLHNLYYDRDKIQSILTDVLSACKDKPVT